MKIFSFIFLALLSLEISVFSQSASAPPTDDVQLWNETTVIFPLYKTVNAKGKQSERISLFFNGVLRLGRNVSHFTDERIGFGFDFKVNKYLSFTPAYLYVAAQPYRGRREFENRLRFSVTLEKKFKKFSVRDRNLYEYRFRNSRPDSSRYRNKFQFSLPVLKDGKEYFTPFAADEVYYDFRAKSWTRNDFSVGIGKKFNKNLSADFFYLLRNNKGNVLKYVNAFGVNLKIKID